jgi:DNA polymerase
MTLLEKTRLTKEFHALTGRPNSTTAHLLPWLRERGYPFGDLRKDTVKRALADHPMSPEAKRALALRAGLSKNSTSKFEALIDKTFEGRLTYSYQFGGAARTLRWAGRGVQPQNLTRPEKFMEGRLEEGTDLVRAGDYDELYLRFGPVLPVLSSLVRSSFRAPDGRMLAVSDLNAIENRVIGWAAGCRATLAVFEKNLCPYKSFGTQLFGIPYEDITKQQRTDSKPAVLGGGYRLGGGEIRTNKNGDQVKTGLWGYAEAMGVHLTREQAHHAIRVFRETYPAIVQFWYDLEEAAYLAVSQHVTTRVGYLVFDYQPGVMRIRLPSGRHLHYLRPAYRPVKFDGKDGPYTRHVLFYDGVDSSPTGSKRWGRLPTHGGKMAENVTQAISRDVIAVGLVRAKKARFDIIGHAHDEIITEVDEGGEHTHERLGELMSAPIRWAPGLPLRAAGYTAKFYRKD